MTYKTILVHLDASPECGRRVDIAARVARAFDARLVGVAAVEPLELPQRLRSNARAKALLGEELDKALAAARSLVRDFPARAEAAGAPAARASVVQAAPLEALSAAARKADLLVVSQPDPDDIGALGAHFLERAVIEAGRPALVVPRKGGAKDVGRKVLVAWKDAPASSRAMADAMPFLRGAQAVVALAVDEGAGRADAREAVEYLARHGVKATAATVKAEDAGRAILAQAKKAGADLVVMGAFARPRLAEMILGGATRTVLKSMGTCVFMSH